MSVLYWRVSAVPPLTAGMTGYGNYGRLDQILREAIGWSKYIGRRVRVRLVAVQNDDGTWRWERKDD